MDASTPETAPVTVNMVLDRFVAEYIPNELALRTQVDYLRHVRTLRKLFGERVVEELKPKDFGPFISVQGRGRIQRVRQLAVLSAAFTQAVSAWYLIERNVLRDVKRPKSKPRDRLVGDDEFAACRAIAPVRVKLAMDLAIITGQRQGDILNFRWRDITDLPSPVGALTQELNVYQSKTGKRIGIAITKELEAVLDRCWQLKGRDEFILSRRIGGRYTSEGFRALWQRTMRKYVRGGGTRFTFHDLRALAATKQPTPEAAMRLLGHSNISMTLRVYRRGVERVIPTQLGV